MIQSDGKIVVAGESLLASPPWGDFTVARYNADGSLDPTFSGDGIAYADLARDYDDGYGAALQSDGKIVVAGKSWNGATGDYDFGVVRFNRDGSLDGSFGAGGIVLTDTGGGGDQAESVAVQSDGKIVVVGRDWVSTDFVVVRYNADGSLDTSFGGGIVRTDINVSQDWAYDVVIQPDGKILVTGEGFYSGGSAMDVALVRYNSNGSLDTSFGGDGIVITTLSNGYDRGEAIALQPDGRILVAATRDYNGGNPDIALLRYRADGNLDTSFHGDGVVITDVGGRADGSHDLRVQSDGKILLVGTSSNGSNLDFALARYNADGSLDTSFGGDGIVTTAIGGGDDDGLGIALQADGKIVVAGSAQNGSEWDFAVARYYPNGSLDDGSCPPR
jgi:uncharacterized delta-60 repeat protein